MRMNHTFFEALGSEPRIKMLRLLCSQTEASAGVLGQISGVAQSSASQHLAKLREVGIITARRRAQSVLYALAEDFPYEIRRGIING